jgi:DNA-binding HxlR family transcriptional regulator
MIYCPTECSQAIMNREEVCGLLERPRTVRTLILLLEASDKTPVSELLEEVGGSRSTGINRLNELREAGLVVKRPGDNRTLYELTDDGQTVARHLLDVVRDIQEISASNEN